MNRAKPISAVLHTLLAGCLLTSLLTPAEAQNPSKRIADLFKGMHQRQAKQQRVFTDPKAAIPRSMVQRRLPAKTLQKMRHRAPGDGAVTRQTDLLTYRVDPPTTQNPNPLLRRGVPSQAQEGHPWWTYDEKYIYFDSNRKSETDTAIRTDGAFNIFRMGADGSGLLQVTDGSDNKLEPNVSRDGARLAYVAAGTISTGPDLSITTSGFKLYVLNMTTGDLRNNLTSGNPSGFSFSDIRHPSWAPGSNEIAFAGKLTADPGRYHIFKVNTDTGIITQLTTGTSNDYAPAWSPDGNLIAFTTNATAFSAGGGPVSATALKANEDIFIVAANQFVPNPKRITDGTFGGKASSNRNPAWSTLRPDPLQVVPAETNQNGDIVSARQLLAFASNRIDSDNDGVADTVGITTDIYWLNTSVLPDPNVPGSYTVTTPESAGNPAIRLQTSTPDTAIDPTEPSSGFDPTHATNEDYPAWPQYINSYRVAFVSNRGNNTNVWASTVFDVNAPTLLRYDQQINQVVGVLRDADAKALYPPNDRAALSREFAAGETVRFRVRAVDYESGIESVYVQIKNPNSQPQSRDGLEHKTFFVGSNVGLAFLDNTNFVVDAPFEWDSQAINPNLYTWRANGFITPELRDTFGTVPGNWPGWNRYLAGISDDVAFSGASAPPDPDFWLQLYDDGAFDDPDPAKRGHEPSGEKKGDGIYTNVWQTPSSLPSDWYLDVIVRDRAIDPFNPESQVNWKIYDNIWGFTTQPFNGTGTVLYVNDYDSGQKWFQTRFGAGTTFGLGYNGVPTESWMTEYDPKMVPQFYNNGTRNGFLLNFLQPLGQQSYTDSLTNDGTAIPITQRYDQWRILSRGPVPDSVLNQYGMHKEVQPADILSGGTGPREAYVAERMVIWHAPYPGNLFVGPGTIIETGVQQQLRTFLENGGRLFLTGQDVAWALSLGTPGASAFLDQIFKVKYVDDYANVNPDNNGITLIRGVTTHPISTEYWAFHAYPGAIPNDPPASGPIYIDSTTSVTRTYGAPNAVSPDIISFGTPVDNIAGIDGNYAVLATPALVWNTNTANHSRVVFSPLPWEAINPEFFTGNNIITLKNRRAEMTHNIGDYLRSGRIIGQVRDFNAGTAVGKVFIRATEIYTGQTGATALTQEDGSYSLNGLEATGGYRIDVFRAGFVAQHLQAAFFHGGYRNRLDIFLQKAQPGTISGTITVAGNGTPVAGAIVVATDPISRTTFTDTTKTDGTYRIKDVPSISDPTNPSTPVGYIVRVTNVQGLGYGSSTPPSYGHLPDEQPATGEKPAVQVGNSQDVTGVDFALKPLPGQIKGKVTKRDVNGNDTGTGIPGATVTAINGGTTVTAVTGNDGTYTIANTDPGSYSVYAAAPGFKDSDKVTAVVVSNKDTLSINFALYRTPPGSISGLVATRLGSGIQGVTVTLTDAGGNRLKDADGNVIPTVTTTAIQTANGYTYNYKFDNNVPAGTGIGVSVAKAGYTDKTGKQTVTVKTGEETKNVNFTLAPLASFEQGLTMVSSPYQYNGLVADTLNLSPADRATFLFATWTGTTYARYPTPPADNFHWGRGYFLDLKNGGADLTVAGTTPPVNKPFEIALQPGWNMIGNPLVDDKGAPYPVNFLALKIRDTNNALIDVPTAQTGSNPALGGALWTYEAGNYQIAYTLDPFRGYWIRAYRAVTLLVDPNARQNRSAATGNAKGDGWMLNLTAQAGDKRSAPAFLGVSRNAIDGFDRFKVETPPAVGSENVTLAVEHKDWADKSGKYSQDVRSAAPTAQAWEFTVNSNVANTPVTLHWPAVATIPGKHDMILTDLDNQTKVNLRNRSSYVIAASAKPITRHFRLEVKRAGRQRLQLTDVVAQVNGSAGRGVTSVGISYRISADAQVQINIMQNGRRVRTVEPGRQRSAGSENVTWDLRNDRGTVVAGNTYTVEVRAVDGDGNIVRQITPLQITR